MAWQHFKRHCASAAHARRRISSFNLISICSGDDSTWQRRAHTCAPPRGARTAPYCARTRASRKTRHLVGFTTLRAYIWLALKITRAAFRRGGGFRAIPFVYKTYSLRLRDSAASWFAQTGGVYARMAAAAPRAWRRRQNIVSLAASRNATTRLPATRGTTVTTPPLRTAFLSLSLLPTYSHVCGLEDECFSIIYTKPPP